ncbi:MAG TPA: class I SAM-dependent methyltransferase [Acetobacteraceae bacterium]|nr:class I SAM-dependent methyltransferase [Acetobacteraceae bacterium]
MDVSSAVKAGIDRLDKQARRFARRLINYSGYDISRTDNGKPRWSGVAEDYYPINVRPRWGYSCNSHDIIVKLLNSEIESFKLLLSDFKKCEDIFASIPYDQLSPTQPCWNNAFFSTLDAAALMYFAMRRKPGIYLEIGSGYSTKFMKSAIDHAGLDTRIISIDPHPRSEVDNICNDLIRSPLEDVDLAIFDRLGSGDICFFDGSHRVFTNSDTTVFFIDVLPHLKKGVLVHIHDIFWPDDYTPEWNGRLYSEQYLLGALLLSGSPRYRVVLPNYFVAKNASTAAIINTLAIPSVYPGTTKPGLSFWLEIL